MVLVVPSLFGLMTEMLIMTFMLCILLHRAAYSVLLMDLLSRLMQITKSIQKSALMVPVELLLPMSSIFMIFMPV